jgi:hypothetical protein
MKQAIVYFLRTNAVKTVWDKVAKLAVMIGGERLAAWLTYKGIEWDNSNPGGPSILCISRPLFSKDVEQMRMRTKYNFPSILGGFVRFQKMWFPEGMQEQRFYQRWQRQNPEAAEKAIKHSKKYAEHILDMVAKREKISAVMSANYDYWQDVGFKYACRDRGIPFLVLSREHPTVQHDLEKESGYYVESQFHFEGAGIATGGPQTLEMLKPVKEFIDDWDDVWQTGFPRLDAWADVDVTTPLQDRDTITLITYRKGYLADEGFVEMIRLFASAAARHKDSGLKFAVKCKDYDDRVEVEKLLEGYDSSNLTLMSEIALYDLLPKSRLIIGYNSLAMVDALLSRAMVVNPWWGDHERPIPQSMINPADEDMIKTILFPRSAEEMNEMLDKSVAGEYEMPPAEEMHKIADKFFFEPYKGEASKRVEEFIDYYLKKAA